MYYRRWVVILGLVLSLSGAVAQQNSSFDLGTWKAYLPAGEYTQLVKGTESVIVVNPFQLVFYYPETNEELLLHKGNGLSDIGISYVNYIDSQGAVVVGYENGNVDIVTPDRTYNIPGIKNNQNILASKRINDIAVFGDQVYLATDFGVVEINTTIYEFGSTLFTDEPVLHIEAQVESNTLFAATGSEMYFLEIQPSTNLADIQEWEIFPASEEGDIQDAAVWGGDIYLVVGDQLWKLVDQLLSGVGVTGSKIRFIKPADSHLLVVNEYDNIFTWDGQQSVQFINLCLLQMRDVLMVNPRVFWYVKQHEFGLYQNDECQSRELPGVPSRFVTEMTVFNDDLYVATGGVSRIYNNLYREDGFYTNASGQWVTHRNTTEPVLGAVDMRDVYQVEKVPSRNQLYFGTFWSGVIGYEEGELTLFDETNSSLQFSVTNPDRIRVADLFLDREENLWVANHDAIRPLSVMTPAGEWRNFAIDVNPRIEKLIVDEYQNIWMAIAERGLYIFNPHDWDDEGDDESRLIIPQAGDESGTSFDNARINEIVIDRNGGVWLGTESGPVLFDCGNIAFDNICQGRKPVIELNGDLGVLLGNENVRAIAIDGGNRKWFGTDNGVYVISGAIDRIDHHFRSDNSPLPSNSIVDIAIDPVSGEVFIATESGLVSYRGEATEDDPASFSPLAVFPNPVPPAYAGPIGIKNLPENALVRITTLAGRLIYEDRALGGQLVWDRLDQDGRNVANGIYLVFATQDKSLAPYTQVGKIFLLD